MDTEDAPHHLRVGGVPIRLHWSLWLIAAVAVWDAATQLRDVVGSPAAAIGLALPTTVGMLASILWHELAHARRGRRDGLHVHGIHLFVFGGVTMMDDGTPTPGATFRVAATGPWRSLQMAAALGLATAGLDWFALLPWLAAVLGQLAWFNLALGVFNALPAAPLDGGRVLEAIVWRLTGSRRVGMRTAAVTGIGLGLALWLLAGALVVRFLQVPQAEAVAGVMGRWSGLWAGLWLTVVAAFLAALALSTWRRAEGADDTHDADTAAAADPGPDPHRGSRWRRRVAAAGGAVLVVAGGVVVPMPWIVSWPRPAVDIAPTVTVDGPTTRLHGAALMLSVSQYHAGIIPTAWALVDDAYEVERRTEVIPPGVGDREYLSSQRRVFASAVDAAAAAALASAGEEVTTTMKVVVQSVLEGSAADGVLRPGDVLVALDGTPVGSVEELSRATAAMDDGDRVTVRVLRDGRVRELDVVIGPLPGGRRSGIGVSLGEVLTDLRLPRGVSSSVTTVGGPSAGLVTALVVYDRVADVDLLAGRTVAATATVEPNGAVGRIGALPEKVVAAEAADTDVLVVHTSQADRARRLADGDMVVVGAATLSEAIAALVVR